MTWRQSFVFCKETRFGKGHDVSEMLGLWYQPPPSSKFTYTYSRDLTKLGQVGQRVWKDVAYGKVSGSWQWTFPLDYEYLEPFLFVYDTYKFATDESTGYHRFYRTDEKSTPTFSVRIKTLNRVVGGPGDAIDELYGCKVTTIKISSSAGSSQSMVNLGGVFVDAQQGVPNMPVGELDALDYVHRAHHAVQYSCLYIGDDPISDVQSLSVQSKNNVSMVYGVLNPIARSCWETNVSNTFSCKILSKDTSVFRQRVYTGGYSAGQRTNWTQLAPLPSISLRSTSDAGEACTMSLENIVIRTIGMNGDEDILVDTLDSAEFNGFELAFTNNVPYQYDLCQDSLGHYNTEVQGNPRPFVIETSGGERVIPVGYEGHFINSTLYV